MDFSLSEEQRMLKDSAARFVKKECQFERRREQMRSPLGYCDKQWTQMVELGWLCIPFSEKYDGLGGSLEDIMVLLEELGKGLMVEPWLSTVILGGRLVEMLGTEQQKREVIPAVCGGQMKLALAYSEVGIRQQLAAIAMEAKPRDGGFVLNGEKVLVLSAQTADQLLVVARTRGNAGDEHGLTVFLVDPNTSGVTLSGYATVDGYRAANIIFDNVQVSGSSVVGGGEAGLGNALESLQVVMNEATLAVGAEAVGLMDLLYQATLEYTKTRKQFGVPIGKFQVLQHRLVDVFMQCEQSRSVLLMAVLHYVENPKESNKSVSGLKVQIGKSGRQVGQEAIQLHGGMGMTDELSVGYYFKRLTCIDALFGNVDFHLARYAELV